MSILKEYRIEIWEKKVIIRNGGDLQSVSSSIKREIDFINLNPDRHAIVHSIEDITELPNKKLK